MNDLQELFQVSTRLVDETLEGLIPSAGTEPRRLHRAIRWSLFAGGKRFRPAMVIAVGTAFGAPISSLLRTASAVEMIHTYSLIHDDLPSMDNDDLRRGRETCHKKFDEATAILAGDVLETLAFQAVAEDDGLSAEMRIRLIAELAQAAGTPFGMVAGQQLDLEAEGCDVSIDTVERIHRFKTGALIAACAKAGAIIGNGGPSEIDAITNYSASLGLLFQITDDLLDVTQTTEDLGKTARKDIAAKKATYPSVIGNDAAAVIAGDLCQQAIAALSPIDRPTGLLADIARYILERGS
mgnify:CR=1 FL=1